MSNTVKKTPVNKASRPTTKRRGVNAPSTALSAEAKQQRNLSLWRSAIFALFGILSVANTTAVQEIEGNFSFWVDKVGGTEVAYSVPVVLIWAALSASLLGTAFLQFARGARFKWRIAIALISPLFLFAAIASLLDGTTANLTVFFSSTLSFAIPVGIGALAGIVAERSGFLNIAVEGKLLFGAMVAAIVSSVTGSVIAGPISGAIAGAVVSLFLAWLGIRYRVDHIIAGTVINIGAVGVTSFVFQRILQPFSEFNRPNAIAPISIPYLSDIPVIGPIFFALSPYFYIAVALVLFFTYMIYRTRWGLRLRAAGEQPNAAGTVGIDVVLPGHVDCRSLGWFCWKLYFAERHRWIRHERERRQRFHRFGCGDLRCVESGLCIRSGASVWYHQLCRRSSRGARSRTSPAGHSLDSLGGHDHRGGRPYWSRARTSIGWPSVRPGIGR
jgi:simple sugar transport system permease protein